MNDRRAQGDVCGPVVEFEELHWKMRPMTCRVEAGSHQQSKEEIGCQQPDADKPDIGRQLDSRGHLLSFYDTTERGRYIFMSCR